MSGAILTFSRWGDDVDKMKAFNNRLVLLRMTKAICTHNSSSLSSSSPSSSPSSSSPSSSSSAPSSPSSSTTTTTSNHTGIFHLAVLIPRPDIPTPTPTMQVCTCSEPQKTQRAIQNADIIIHKT